ncbi:MAG: DNA polymerase III subunit delta [Anaerolineae bacterium]|nr:DNA polymerase III subunit delta [Anaerolineae bacterium]
MFHILHGENELERTEALAKIIKSSGLEPDLKDLNTEVLDAPVTFGELRRACSTIPFLGNVRVVVANNVLSKADKQTTQAIAEYLPDLPPTTCLIFVETQNIPARNAILKLAKEVNAKVRLFSLPKVRDLPGWIRTRVQSYQGDIDHGAAALLAQNIGADLRLLDQEIQKLLLYVSADTRYGGSKPITQEDVQVMVPYIQSADVIFNMVDALGQRKPRDAARYLHQLLDVGGHPLGIFGMIARQFRLLIQVGWLRDQGYIQQDIAGRLKLHPFVAGKLYNQTSFFTPEQLRKAYQMLLESDLSMKTGQVSPEAALDLLVVELTSL